jgi:hypothetical protein
LQPECFGNKRAKSDHNQKRALTRQKLFSLLVRLDAYTTHVEMPNNLLMGENIDLELV